MNDLEHFNHKILMSWWSHYEYKSLGNILHWLYVYCDLRVAEEAIVGPETIVYYGKLLASYRFDEEKRIPIFKFANNTFNDIQNNYLKLLEDNNEKLSSMR